MPLVFLSVGVQAANGKFAKIRWVCPIVPIFA